MALEIERKFLVKTKAFKLDAIRSYKIIQGFLNSHKERTVRVRLVNGKGFLTIKGLSSNDGLKRFEWEKEIPLKDAESLLRICEDHIIEKIRYEIKSGDSHLYEVDEFEGKNAGLIIAEIELQSEDEFFSKPDWLGQEVTGNIKYYNSQLGRNPYSKW